MTNIDKLFMYVMETCRPDQVEALVAISQTKGRPISVMVVGAVRITGVLSSFETFAGARVHRYVRKDDSNKLYYVGISFGK
jgi:hypothetical protein